MDKSAKTAQLLHNFIHQVLHRFKSYSQCVRDSRWWGSLKMVSARNKAKRLSSVNHTKKKGFIKKFSFQNAIFITCYFPEGSMGILSLRLFEYCILYSSWNNYPITIWSLVLSIILRVDLRRGYHFITYERKSLTKYIWNKEFLFS